MNRYFFLLLTLLALNVLPAYAEPLKGKVEHEDQTPISGDIWNDAESEKLPAGRSFSETVEAVGPQLKVHKLFSSIAMPAEDKEDMWYQIPKWRAGMFHRDKQIDHTQFGDVESVSKVDHFYGMQVDKKGGIWHHVSWPHVTKLSLDGYSQIKIINSYEPIISNDHEFTVKISSTNIDVDDKTGKITRIGKQEEYDRYFPAGPGVAHGFCLIQGYSKDGRPNTTVEKCTVVESLTQPFSAVSTFQGKNLNESFKRFLTSHDLADLMP